MSMSCGSQRGSHRERKGPSRTGKRASDLGALGGTRTPNLLIRSWLPLVPRGLKGSDAVLFRHVTSAFDDADLDPLRRGATSRDTIVGSNVGFPPDCWRSAGGQHRKPTGGQYRLPAGGQVITRSEVVAIGRLGTCAHSRRYLKPVSRCLRCSRRGCFVCIFCVVGCITCTVSPPQAQCGPPCRCCF